jgi:hypothetical protein
LHPKRRCQTNRRDVAIDVAKSSSDVAISAQDVANLHARLATCRGTVKYAEHILCHLSLFLSLNCTEMAMWCPRLLVTAIKQYHCDSQRRRNHVRLLDSFHWMFFDFLITLPLRIFFISDYVFFLNDFWLVWTRLRPCSTVEHGSTSDHARLSSMHILTQGIQPSGTAECSHSSLTAR